MRLCDRTLLFSLDTVIGDIDIENKVISILVQYKRKFFKDFKIFLFTKNINKTRVNDFLKKYSKDLKGIDIHIINSKVKSCWFVINLEYEVDTWRYLYKGGNIVDGLKSYIKILKHIERKDK
jgi:hypothetical protein